MTIQLMNQIQLAERGLTTIDHRTDARFAPDAPSSLREFGARMLRTTATGGLRLAERLDPHYA